MIPVQHDLFIFDLGYRDIKHIVVLRVDLQDHAFFRINIIRKIGPLNIDQLVFIIGTIALFLSNFYSLAVSRDHPFNCLLKSWDNLALPQGKFQRISLV